MVFTDVNKDDNKLDVIISDDDKCYTCATKSLCPLMQAIISETVILRYESIEVRDCPMYIVDNNPEEIEICQ